MSLRAWCYEIQSEEKGDRYRSKLKLSFWRCWGRGEINKAVYPLGDNELRIAVRRNLPRQQFQIQSF